MVQFYCGWSLFNEVLLVFPVFILTDWLRYKPVVCIEGLSYIGCWALLLWARGVGAMQLMECFYGVATSTEVAYYTYIYSQVYKTSTAPQTTPYYVRNVLFSNTLKFHYKGC